MVSIMFCLFILFNEYFIMLIINTNTAIIEINTPLIGNINPKSTLSSKALNIKYDNPKPIGIPINNDLVP